jgi:hypothetical protein
MPVSGCGAAGFIVRAEASEQQCIGPLAPLSMKRFMAVI